MEVTLSIAISPEVWVYCHVMILLLLLYASFPT
jgi:hypothetical protein